MNLREITQQYHGSTLPELVEKQLKSMSEATLLKAIRGTFDNFPNEDRELINTFTENFLENWFDPHILTDDLGDIFSDAVKNIQNITTQTDVLLDDERTFDVFNIMVMKLSHFAHSHPVFRKKMGIKKGRFW